MTDRWRRESSHPRGDYRVFRVREDTYSHPAVQDERSYFVIEAPDWANVVALTPAGEVVLVTQFRQGVAAVRLEIPGGIVEAGEVPAVAAVRELREETGYVGAAPELLCVVEPNPALQDNRCWTFVVRDARPVDAPAGDSDEVLRVELCALTDLRARVSAGEVPHALIQLALLRFLANCDD
ncbi:MAG TPA: NUDIX hydrolase [Planctomycetota bacterium]